MAWASVKETNQRTEQTNEPGLSRLITRHRDGERYLNTWMQDRLQVIGAYERDRLVFRLPRGGVPFVPGPPVWWAQIILPLFG